MSENRIAGSCYSAVLNYSAALYSGCSFCAAVTNPVNQDSGYLFRIQQPVQHDPGVHRIRTEPAAHIDGVVDDFSMLRHILSGFTAEYPIEEIAVDTVYPPPCPGQAHSSLLVSVFLLPASLLPHIRYIPGSWRCSAAFFPRRSGR